MKLLVASDLHLSRGGIALSAGDADVVVLAGDIARPKYAVPFASELSKPVIYVAGNHEYYDGSIAGTLATLRALSHGTSVHVLERDELVVDGVRFLGATLWTDFMLDEDADRRARAVEACARYLRDFQVIRASEDDDRLFTPQDAAAIHLETVCWLADRLAQPCDLPTVVVTHHAPSPRSIHPRFAESLVNASYISRLEHLLDGDRVALWIHGHTHDSFEYEVDGTRVVCNPRGYVINGVGENGAFDPAHMIEVGP